MKKEHLIVVGAIVLIGLGMALLGPKDNRVRDGMTRIKEALMAREVPVVVVTRGKDGANADLVRGVKAAAAGARHTRFIHIDALSPNERDVAKNYIGAKLPLVTVVGLDGRPAYQGTAPPEPEAIKQAIADALTRKPMEIEAAPEGHEH
jgi:hypothetical protein